MAGCLRAREKVVTVCVVKYQMAPGFFPVTIYFPCYKARIVWKLRNSYRTFFASDFPTSIFHTSLSSFINKYRFRTALHRSPRRSHSFGDHVKALPARSSRRACDFGRRSWGLKWSSGPEAGTWYNPFRKVVSMCCIILF